MIDTSIPAAPPDIGPELAGLRMTPEEFDAIEDYDEGCRYELVQGVLVVTPVPLEAEADPNEELGYLLRDYQKRHPQGKVLDKTLAERYVRLATGRRRADRVIWAGLGRRPDPRLDPPTIAVEFVSSGHRNRTRDFIDKRREYEAAGVQEYWIIDRFSRQMTVFGMRPGLSGERHVQEGDRYETTLLPGFVLTLADILGVADEWK